MKASHAAMLLLACHSGNVMAAPAAHGNGLTSGPKAERKAPPFKFTNNLLDPRDASCKEESSFVTLRREQVEDKTGSESTTFGPHPKQCEAMVLANTMLTSAFEFLHRVPLAHDKHARDNIHQRDFLRREEAMHRAVRQAAREAQGLGLERNIVTNMFKTLSDTNHASHPLNDRDTSSLSFVLKSFFDALKAFFAELKAAESRRGSHHHRPGLPPTGTQSTGRAIPTPSRSGLPDSESPDDPELPPTDFISPEPIPFVVDDPYGNDYHRGNHYGGGSYGGHGGDHYGGNSYGGDHHHGSDSFGDDHYPGDDPYWNDPNESSSVSLKSGSLPTDITTGVQPTGSLISKHPSGLLTPGVLISPSLPPFEKTGTLAIETTPTSYYQSGVPTNIDSSQLPTGLPSGFIPTSLLPSGVIPTDLPTGLPSGLITASLLPSSLIPTGVLPSGDITTDLLTGLFPTGLPTDVPSPPDYGGDAEDTRTSFPDYGQAPSDLHTGLPSGLIHTGVLSSGAIRSLFPSGLSTGLPSGLIPTSLLPSGLISTGLPTDVPSPPDYGGDAGEISTSFPDYGQALSDPPTGLPSGLIPTSVLPSGVIPSRLPSGLSSGFIPTSLLISRAIPSKLSTGPAVIPPGIPTAVPPGFIPIGLLPSTVIPSRLPTGLPSGLIPATLLPSGFTPVYTIPTTGIWTGLVPTQVVNTDMESGLLPPEFTNTRTDIFDSEDGDDNPFPDGLPADLFPPKGKGFRTAAPQPSSLPVSSQSGGTFPTRAPVAGGSSA
ncbi:hypothetical protein E4U59_006762 [Claviceps monticola]|nr:hypothetical protein E4U59_006762 [Claviceps monticola]